MLTQPCLGQRPTLGSPLRPNGFKFPVTVANLSTTAALGSTRVERALFLSLGALSHANFAESHHQITQPHPQLGVRPRMTHPIVNTWEIASGVTSLLALTGLALWLVLHKRPTSEELEQTRRQFLVQSGRLVDAMLLDIYDVETTGKKKKDPNRTLTMLLYQYRIGGVDYECSQDITQLSDIVDPAQVRAGFPCTVRYQPGNPQNSIVVAEGWSGMRLGLPVLPTYQDPDPIDSSHLDSLRPGHS